jgi:hypothetical protein
MPARLPEDAADDRVFSAWSGWNPMVRLGVVFGWIDSRPRLTIHLPRRTFIVGWVWK